MLVEDEEDFSSLVKIHLERLNEKLNIYTYTSASEALKALKNESFNVIVSDYHMPDIDGLDFLSRIRKMNLTTPFILFTGVDQDELEDMAFNAGAIYFIKKHLGADVRQSIAELNKFLNFILRQQKKATKEGLDHFKSVKTDLKPVFNISDHLDLIFQNIEFGLYVLDLEGQVIYANKKAALDIGYRSVDELLANKSNKDIFAILDVYNPKYFNFLTKQFNFKRGEELFSDELINIPINDDFINERWFLKKITPIFSSDYILQFVAVSTYDMSNIMKNEYQSRRELQHSLLINNCFDLLYHAIDEQDFMDSFCKLLVEKGDYVLVWIGSAEIHHKQKVVLTMASYGFESDYLDNIKISWDDSNTGSGPVGTAIKSGMISVFNDIASNKQFSPWRDSALRRGYHSCMAIPLLLSNESAVQGSLNIYSSKKNAFTKNDEQFYTNLSRILATGLQILKTGTDLLVDEVFNDFPIPLIDANITEFFNLSNEIRQFYLGEFRNYIEDHSEIIAQILSSVNVTRVNKKTLDLFKTTSELMIQNFANYFSSKSLEPFKEIVIALHEGKKEIIRRITIKTAEIERLDVMIKLVLETKSKGLTNHLLIAIITI